ncbi:MAG: hypothetical protein IPM29_21840 [Planctomycetes bacterium]|nr:hypothetical protein [Planctomycetota bacterium]
MTATARDRWLWVGPLCRYFAGGDGHGALTRVAGVEAWRDDLEAALGGRIRGALDWREEPAAPGSTAELGAGLDAVRLLAIHAERTDAELPDALPAQLDDDPLWRAARAANFSPSLYGHVVAADCWLPADFDFTFVAPRPDGEDWCFGSLVALCDQLHFLDARTFATGDDERAALAAAPLDPTSFVRAARVGLARMRLAATAARAARQVLAVGGPP